MADDFLEQLKAELRANASKDSLFNYRPYKGAQEDAHNSTKRGRIFLGGNRSGKTVFGAVESIRYLTGSHPTRATPKPPVYGRGSAVDIEQGLNKIMLPEIARWLPKKFLLKGSWDESYDKSSRVLTLNNGSKMDFLTYEQLPEKHAGTSRHFCWWDEEPPEFIFNEDMLRLVDVNGHWWMSMTPLLGFTWVYHKYYSPIVEHNQPNPSVDVFLGSTENNPHVSKEILDEITEGLSAEEKSARRHGRFMAASGLVYPSFGKHLVIPPIDAARVAVPVFNAMDHGLRHPTVFLYAYVDQEGRLIVFHEYYEAERTIPQHVETIRKWERATGIEQRLVYSIGDPAIEQRTPSGLSVRSMYSQEGYYLGLGNNDVAAGINKTRSYIERMGVFITEDCPNLISELYGYRWDTYATRKANETKKQQDKPRKLKDDACDTLRYLIMSRPDDEFEGWAGEVFANFIVASKAAPDTSGAGDYSAEELEPMGAEGVHTILGSEW